jgi:hypothetical protein
VECQLWLVGTTLLPSICDNWQQQYSLRLHWLVTCSVALMNTKPFSCLINLSSSAWMNSALSQCIQWLTLQEYFVVLALDHFSLCVTCLWFWTDLPLLSTSTCLYHMDKSAVEVIQQKPGSPHHAICYGILTKTFGCMEKKLQRLPAPSKLCEQRGQFVPHAVKEHKGTKKSLV